MQPNKATPGEAMAIARRIKEDLARLGRGEAVHALMHSVHWQSVKTRVIDDAILSGDVYSPEDYREATSEGDAAKTEYEERLALFEADVDRLHEAICSGRMADACDLLRSICPEHNFMSDAAQLMLAGIRNGGGHHAA